jgi:hypothetical protein
VRECPSIQLTKNFPDRVFAPYRGAAMHARIRFTLRLPRGKKSEMSGLGFG